MGLWGTEMERDVVRKRQYTGYVTVKHVKYNRTKREVTSYRNDKKRNAKRRKRLNAIYNSIRDRVYSTFTECFLSLLFHDDNV